MTILAKHTYRRLEGSGPDDRLGISLEARRLKKLTKELARTKGPKTSGYCGSRGQDILLNEVIGGQCFF